MRVSSVSPNLNNNYFSRLSSFRGNSFVPAQNGGGDIFVKNGRAEDKKLGFLLKTIEAYLSKCEKISAERELQRVVSEFIDKKDKFQISDYMKLTEREKYAIEMKIGLNELFAAAQSVTLGTGLKEMLDEKYGKDGYVFVSIGTSPSMIAKVLECEGVETRYLPISNLRKTSAEEIINETDFSKYGKFLEGQGISAEKLSSSDKKFIFYDYTHKGNSLKRFKKLMLEKFNLPDEKTEFRSLNEDLLSIFKGKIYIDDEDMVEAYIHHYLNGARAEDYSTVVHLPVSKIDTADYSRDALTRHDCTEVKSFNFHVMRTLEKNGLLAENPENACAL